jgi:hypothetical protein
LDRVTPQSAHCQSPMGGTGEVAVTTPPPLSRVGRPCCTARDRRYSEGLARLLHRTCHRLQSEEHSNRPASRQDRTVIIAKSIHLVRCWPPVGTYLSLSVPLTISPSADGPLHFITRSKCRWISMSIRLTSAHLPFLNTVKLAAVAAKDIPELPRWASGGDKPTGRRLDMSEKWPARIALTICRCQ